MSYEAKALSCENCWNGGCPNKDHPSIAKASLRFIVTPEIMDTMLSPLDLEKLYVFCRDCPEYIEDRLALYYHGDRSSESETSADGGLGKSIKCN